VIKMDDIDELIYGEDEPIKKKKTGRRTTGKYKCRGKHQNRDVY
jgi:hypothetical protein